MLVFYVGLLFYSATAQLCQSFECSSSCCSGGSCEFRRSYCEDYFCTNYNCDGTHNHQTQKKVIRKVHQQSVHPFRIIVLPLHQSRTICYGVVHTGDDKLNFEQPTQQNMAIECRIKPWACIPWSSCSDSTKLLEKWSTPSVPSNRPIEFKEISWTNEFRDTY